MELKPFRILKEIDRTTYYPALLAAFSTFSSGACLTLSNGYKNNTMLRKHVCETAIP